MAAGDVIAILLLVSTTISVVCGTLTVVPDNAATTANTGSSVRFTCRTDSGGSIRWTLRDLDIRNPIRTVYDGSTVTVDFRARFSVTPTGNGQYDLVIANVQAVDPGTYICTEISGSDTAAAILTVIVGSPVCSTSIRTADIVDGTPVHMQCNVSYNGSIWQRPQMTWYSSDDFVKNTSTVGNPNIAVWSVVDFAAEPPIVNYSCATHFRTPYFSDDQPLNLSQSVPSYRFVYKPPAVPVVYLGDLEVLGVSDNGTVFINESITCWTDGNPPPTFRWYDLTDNQVVIGPTIAFHELGPRTLNCSATNVHSGITYVSSLRVDILVINVCTYDPCQNGGICDIFSNPLCTCQPGFSGIYCEINIDECASGPCQNGASCNDLIDGYSCACAPGYTGSYCEIDVNECDSTPCLNWGTCDDQVNGFVCYCPVGFLGTTCELIDAVPPPPTTAALSGVFAGASTLTMSCVQKYIRQFSLAIDEQVARMQYLVTDRQLCSMMDPGTELISPQGVVGSINGSSSVDLLFSMDVRATPNNFIDQQVSCTYEVAWYAADHDNWLQPILTQIAGCPAVAFNYPYFNVSAVDWYCG